MTLKLWMDKTTNGLHASLCPEAFAKFSDRQTDTCHIGIVSRVKLQRALYSCIHVERKAPVPDG